MYKITIITLLFAAIFESLIIIVGNIFNIFVFWKHRHRLKLTFLLINLAVADLLVGFTEPIALRTYLRRRLKESSFNVDHNGEIFTTFQTSFSFASVVFLALISLERAYALIWPLHHRATSINKYIYGTTLAWIATICNGALRTLAIYDMVNFSYSTIATSCVTVFCLVTVCVSYLAIQKSLKVRNPAVDTSYNQQKEAQRSAQLSRTLFIIITASLLFWFPCLVVYSTHDLCSKCVPLLFLSIINIFRLTSSLLNPVIYSYRIPMFRETCKRTKLCKKSKQYRINQVR